MATTTKAKAAATKTSRYNELRKMLEERRRELMTSVQGKMRDVRAEGGKDRDVLDQGESSEVDIQEDIEFALKTLSKTGIRFEFECYDVGHLYNLHHFLERGLVKPPLFVQTVFGILGGIGPHPEDVIHMKRTADRLFGDKYQWSVLGAGRNQMPIISMALAMGGNVRVGLEDSLWGGPGRLAQSNAEQVTLARKMIEGLGMDVATPDEAREMLGLKGADKVAF